MSESSNVKKSAKTKSYEIYRRLRNLMSNQDNDSSGKKGTPTLIVTGLPGSGKTTSLLYLALYRTNRCIVSFSRRKQRDWWFENIPKVFNLKIRTHLSDDIYEVETKDGKIIAIYRFKAKYEFDDCPLSRKEFDSFLDYMIACLQSQQTIQCRERCPYKRQFSIVANLLRGKRRFVILATHVGGMILDMVFQGVMHIVIDEFDEYVFSLSHLAIPEKKLDEYYLYGDEITKKIIDDIRSNWIYNKTNKVYYPPLIPIHARCAILSTATFVKYFVSFYRGVNAIDIYHVEPRYGDPDIILVWNKTHTLVDWWSDKSKLYTIVKDLATIARRKGKNVGIVVPKKRIAETLARKLEDVGSVYCEEYPDTSKQWITIVVPGDTLYRGLSIEADIVVAFYQRWRFDRTLETAHPWIHHAWRPPSEASTDPSLRGIVDRFGYINPEIVEASIEELNEAYNVQAIFRFVRNHKKRHIVVILDRQMFDALKRFYKNSYLKHCIVKTFDNYLDLLVYYASLLEAI